MKKISIFLSFLQEDSRYIYTHIFNKGMDKSNNLSKCTQHNSHVLNMLQLLSKCESAEICLMYVNQFKIEESELISIEEIINSSTQTIFKNFLLMKDQVMQEKLIKFQKKLWFLKAFKKIYITAN
ncbi:hypothetical protein TTHERM_001237389 (macronuclear) [Tetrahymena thermophila SB210]|uniref:Uncharacterized protein n=1 Tax=Tetrahymena thermophila (strain SB210) TaxID=312017 RepID=W7XHF9_TETTS|nr:hypothetical protein TTHERM_001237389 [Tetrahymena thermophila SB210]EWS76688.1 hypothetical protein TTHERM_001237389 [Tetrahymena thermophila SB210]|eukprot:XP_012650783.1 hypothetical protein TTHERM_001237389 [Tetrahymena thermophila SB210]